MKVLTVGNLYPPHHLGGYELVWQAAVRALRACGHQARVLATTDRFGDDAAGEDPDVHRELRWYWRDHEFPRLPLGQRYRLERHNRSVLIRHLTELRPDVVSWWSMGGMSLSLLTQVRRAGVPAVGWVNDDWLLYAPEVDQWSHLWGRLGPARSLSALTGAPCGPTLGDAARWVFCSETVRTTAARRIDLADTAVLYQGVAPEFEPAPERAWEGRLLYAGRLDSRKGLLTLVDALSRVERATLRILGDGDERFRTELRDRIEALRLGDRVMLEPGVSRRELAAAYAACDAVVFPVEWSEPWGLVPLEAMAVGRPVVATGRGGSSEYLEHERNALLFAAGDPAALAAAVERLEADPALRARLRSGGFATADRLTERSWTDAVVAEHERLAGRA